MIKKVGEMKVNLRSHNIHGRLQIAILRAYRAFLTAEQNK